MTTDNYFGREVRSTGAARVLEALGRPPMRERDAEIDDEINSRNDEENGAEKCG